MSDAINLEFPVITYGNLEKVNETISKARVRILYKGLNRNGIFITDEFAAKLATSLPYAPVKGIYDTDAGDYTNHGESRAQGRIYGIIPEEPNVRWEMHTDEDEIAREYMCADVYLYTALYTEANSIVGKAQSMELYRKSLKGGWEIREGHRAYVFTDGCFLGLSVLGDSVEPCFEGAAFFEKDGKMPTALEVATKLFSLYQKMQGGTMDKENFKLSDEEKARYLWELANPDGEYARCILDVYDDYAVSWNYIDHCYERIYYTKNDETDSVVIDRYEKCFIIDVNESEKNALDNIRKASGTYEIADSTLAAAPQLEANLNDANEKLNVANASLSEANTTIENFNTKFDVATANLSAANATIEDLNGQIAELAAYKAGIEKAQKEGVIASYSEVLSKEILDAYTEKMDSFSVDDLDKELAFELKKSNPSVFSKKTVEGFIPKQETLTGAEALCSKYENLRKGGM